MSDVAALSNVDGSHHGMITQVQRTRTSCSAYATIFTILLVRAMLKDVNSYVGICAGGCVGGVCASKVYNY